MRPIVAFAHSPHSTKDMSGQERCVDRFQTRIPDEVALSDTTSSPVSASNNNSASSATCSAAQPTHTVDQQAEVLKSLQPQAEDFAFLRRIEVIRIHAPPDRARDLVTMWDDYFQPTLLHVRTLNDGRHVLRELNGLLLSYHTSHCI